MVVMDLIPMFIFRLRDMFYCVNIIVSCWWHFLFHRIKILFVLDMVIFLDPWIRVIFLNSSYGRGAYQWFSQTLVHCYMGCISFIFGVLFPNKGRYGFWSWIFHVVGAIIGADISFETVILPSFYIKYRKPSLSLL